MKSTAYQKEWYQKNREQIRERSRKRYAAIRNDPEFKKAQREYRLRINYKITPEEYKEFYSEQQGCCAICKEPGEMYELCVDHNHQTGVVRGLLCTACNTGLGIIEKEQFRLKALEYLEKTNRP